LRVLVAEDNELNQQVMQHLLERQGHTVEIACDGRAALGALAKGGFDLLLLDVHMPELDGFQVVRELRMRERATGRRLPVIALTARSMKEDRERCLEAGMDDFVSKPIRRQDLAAAFARIQARPSKLVLDPATLLSACDGDAGLLERMVAVFRISAPDQLERVAEALRERNSGALRAAAHRLCGLVSAFSPLAADLCRQLEQVEDRHCDSAIAQFSSLQEVVRDLIGLLDNVTLEALRRQAPIPPQP
jgi:CheY-like chemotaxis protein